MSNYISEFEYHFVCSNRDEKIYIVQCSMNEWPNKWIIGAIYIINLNILQIALYSSALKSRMQGEHEADACEM